MAQAGNIRKARAVVLKEKKITQYYRKGGMMRWLIVNGQVNDYQQKRKIADSIMRISKL